MRLGAAVAGLHAVPSDLATCPRALELSVKRESLEVEGLFGLSFTSILLYGMGWSSHSSFALISVDGNPDKALIGGIMYGVKEKTQKDANLGLK